MFRRLILALILMLMVFSTVSAYVIKPAKPTNFRVTALTSTSVTLAWDHDRLNTVYYEIRVWIPGQRYKGCWVEEYQPLTCTITGLSPNTLYYANVAAWNQYQPTNEFVANWAGAIQFSTSNTTLRRCLSCMVRSQ